MKEVFFTINLILMNLKQYANKSPYTFKLYDEIHPP